MEKVNILGPEGDEKKEDDPPNPIDPNAPEIVPIGDRKRFDRGSCIAVGPSYIPVTKMCQESIDFKACIVSDFITTEGEEFMCQMSAFVPASLLNATGFSGLSKEYRKTNA